MKHTQQKQQQQQQQQQEQQKLNQDKKKCKKKDLRIKINELLHNTIQKTKCSQQKKK